MTAPGWYWSQFNPGLPMMLSLLFKAPLPQVPLARFATAFVSGLLGLFPFLIWRPVLAFRWRLLAGTLLALWPSQILFSGVVVQDNWVLAPMIALACVAVRRLRTPEGIGRPVLTALLFVACFAIRQEMLVALAPLAIAAGISGRASGRQARDIATLLVVLGLFTVLLCIQRRQATGRFTIATEHGALVLFGSFMPGAGEEGWIDGRAYAAARYPSAADGLFGSPRELLRLTLEEVERRPAFHALRIASWLPRLALDADSDVLHWSVGVSQAIPQSLRARADVFQRDARPLLIAGLALINGAFAAALMVGFARRRPDILVLASAVAVKFAIHMLASPLGRLVLPAIALELLAIPLAASELSHVSRAKRVRTLLTAAAVSAGLLILVPPLSGLVSRLDSRELVGVRSFRLDAGEMCAIRCEVRRGALIGLTPDRAAFRNAVVECALPVTPPGARLELRVEGAPERILFDGHALPRSPFGTDGTAIPPPVSTVTIEGSNDQPVTFRFRLAERELEPMTPTD